MRISNGALFVQLQGGRPIALLRLKKWLDHGLHLSVDPIELLRASAIEDSINLRLF